MTLGSTIVIVSVVFMFWAQNNGEKTFGFATNISFIHCHLEAYIFVDINKISKFGTFINTLCFCSACKRLFILTSSAYIAHRPAGQLFVYREEECDGEGPYCTRRDAMLERIPEI